MKCINGLVFQQLITEASNCFIHSNFITQIELCLLVRYLCHLKLRQL